MKPNALLAALLLAGASLSLHAMPGAAPVGAAPAGALQGEVLETKDVEGYTYMRLKTKDGETWAAVSTVAVKKGATVSIANPMVMRNFESKTLKKTFDSIVFGSLADPNAKPVAGAAAAGPMAPSGNAGTMHGPLVAKPTIAPVKVPKAKGPDARTVAEVVDGRVKLKDKPVLVHGQVVKVSNGIMGKNWVHLQDGTGNATMGSNDVLVTTKDTVTVGDIVHAKGTVRNDVDLGSGYRYPVLIEDASVKK